MNDLNQKAFENATPVTLKEVQELLPTGFRAVTMDWVNEMDFEATEIEPFVEVLDTMIEHIADCHSPDGHHILIGKGQLAGLRYLSRQLYEHGKKLRELVDAG